MGFGAIRRQGNDFVVAVSVVGEQLHRVARHIGVGDAAVVATVKQRNLPGVQVVFVNVRSDVVQLVIKGRHDIIDNILRIAVAVSIEWAGLSSSGLACRFSGDFRRGGGFRGGRGIRHRGAGGQGEHGGGDKQGQAGVVFHG